MLSAPAQSSIEAIVSSISLGGIVAFPTDTVFALACDATNDDAIRRLFDIKQRDLGKTASILVSSADFACMYAKFHDIALRLAECFWPGPLTMVLPVGNVVDLSQLCIRHSTIAVRVPAHPVALKILSSCGIPLVATSINLAGYPPLNNVKEILRAFGDRIDAIFDIDAHGTMVGVASTVVDLCEARPIILRQGAITLEEIEKAIARGPICP